jgi:hypothetical protein
LGLGKKSAINTRCRSSRVQLQLDTPGSWRKLKQAASRG